MLTNYFPYIIHVISICDIQTVEICPPPLGFNMPVSIDIRVLFPAPLGPSRAVICPSYTLNEASSNAFNNGFLPPCSKCLRILLTLNDEYFCK